MSTHEGGTAAAADPHLVVAVSRADGGVDELRGAAAVHGEADVGRVTAEAATLSHPRHRQHRCHDNQLHPLPVASHTLSHFLVFNGIFLN